MEAPQISEVKLKNVGGRPHKILSQVTLTEHSFEYGYVWGAGMKPRASQMLKYPER